MGGFFGAVSNRDMVLNIFFGTDYHSHLGTRRGGMVMYSRQEGFKKKIHSIENTPFRTKFERELEDFHGTSGIGCISDSDPQPLLIRSHLGMYSISTVGIVNNTDDIIAKYFTETGHQFLPMNDGKINATELVASIINRKKDFVSGIKYAQEIIDGSMTILILNDKGEIIAARDKVGRLPIHVGFSENDGYCVSFETFAYQKLGYRDRYELGPGEIVKIKKDGIDVLSPSNGNLKICAFLWTYYGYPNSNYEGKNVEIMRYRD
ncbi:MAG: amidophosphoribosyltransferase, partial [Oscillospiraceae bacterium]|nr:amidophosphoribosyltransferase [Oscillospiraceae bacterium]